MLTLITLAFLKEVAALMDLAVAGHKADGQKVDKTMKRMVYAVHVS